MNKIKLKGLSDKRYAMSELVGDAYRLNSNKISILAATVELLAKGTQHQKDAGKKFLSDQEIDRLIDSILKEE
jgi:hypothetical protein